MELQKYLHGVTELFLLFNLIVEARWISRPKDTSQEVNSSLTWRCHADGVPPIRYTWLHNGVEMGTSVDRSLYVIREGTLTFPRLRVNQKGMYQCHAANSLRQLITTVQLDVKGT